MGHKCDGCRFKGEHQEMMFRPFGVCLRELNLAEAEKNYNAEKCPYSCVGASHDNKKNMFISVGRGSDKTMTALDNVIEALEDFNKAVRVIRRNM